MKSWETTPFRIIQPQILTENGQMSGTRTYFGNHPGVTVKTQIPELGNEHCKLFT